MTNYDSGAFESHDCADVEQLEKRSVRALTEFMTVLPQGGGIYSVTTESGSEYRVDAIEGRCTCPDARYNLDDDERCKHVRRVGYAEGDRQIPRWADTDAIDLQLGLHVDGSPTVEDVAVTDGGTDEDDDCECIDEFPCADCYIEGEASFK